MAIAIIGSGISGLTAAYYLTQSGFDVRVFESENYIGGHTHTIPVLTSDKTYAIDTGFIVFNDRTYPHFCALLDEIGLTGQDTDMSFSVSDRLDNFEYSGASFSGLFAQKRRLLSPQFYVFLKNIYKAQRALKKALNAENASQETLEDFVKKNAIHPKVTQHYLYPLISALWSSPLAAVEKMPVYFIAHFLENHGLLKMIPDIQWKVIPGGSCTYIPPLIRHFSDKIYLNTKVKKMQETEEGIQLYDNNGTALGLFEKVIIATHSDQTLRLLEKPTPLQSHLLTSIPYQKNSVVLHKDKHLMPQNKKAWASWNYLIKPENTEQAVLTYYMNKLQNLEAAEDYFVTLNADQLIAPDKIIQTFEYHHPQFTRDSLAAQQQHRAINQEGNIYFCGAYWGFGFHEDGVKSGLLVCEEITGRTLLHG